MESVSTYLAVDAMLSNIAWFLIVGIAVAGFLIAGFRLGQRIRAQELPPPAPENQPHLPAGGPVYEVREERDPVQFPASGLRPHEMPGYGNLSTTTSEHPSETRRNRDAQ